MSSTLSFFLDACPRAGVFACPAPVAVLAQRLESAGACPHILMPLRHDRRFP